MVTVPPLIHAGTPCYRSVAHHGDSSRPGGRPSPAVHPCRLRPEGTFAVTTFRALPRQPGRCRPPSWGAGGGGGQGRAHLCRSTQPGPLGTCPTSLPGGYRLPRWVTWNKPPVPSVPHCPHLPMGTTALPSLSCEAGNVLKAFCTPLGRITLN